MESVFLSYISQACVAFCVVHLFGVVRTLLKTTTREHSVLLHANAKTTARHRATPVASLFPTKYRNRQGLLLQTYSWLPAGAPRGVVFLVHGYGEHLGRYEHVGRMLNALGLVVYGVDHQGHGMSEGERCHIEQFDDFVNDLLDYAEATLAGLPPTWQALPRFLVAHSMGGAIAIRAASAFNAAPVHRWDGLVLSGPCLVINPDEATPFLRWLASTLAGIFPKAGVTPSGGGVSWVLLDVLLYLHALHAMHAPLLVYLVMVSMVGSKMVAGGAIFR